VALAARRGSTIDRLVYRKVRRSIQIRSSSARTRELYNWAGDMINIYVYIIPPSRRTVNVSMRHGRAVKITFFTFPLRLLCLNQSRVCSEAHRQNSTLSANHECAAKRTGRTASYQPITSVQRSAQAEQHVISQSRVCSEADRQNSTLSANHECAAKRTGRTARYQPITSVQRSAQAEQLVSAERYDKVFGTK